MATVKVKEEKQAGKFDVSNDLTKPVSVIDLSSSDSDSSDEENGECSGSTKRRKLNGVLPVGFLDPLPPEEVVNTPEQISVVKTTSLSAMAVIRSGDPSKQFWKAGDYEGDLQVQDSGSVSAGLDHVRVHPKFLHSNATSHKWALGAFAELMDNAIDEVCNGSTYVNVDVLDSKKDGTKMLLVEDNGGGMDPDKMRQCMSLGYSEKSKSANTIGQYGNGFKTSTMRLGADVIVFSRCCGKDGKRSSQSIGMLSYTFLRNTRKEDIVVPMLDFKKEGSNWIHMTRVSSVDWDKNLKTILTWSPYISETDLLDQFHSIGKQGTRIVIYNLWENEYGQLELDFIADKEDIQLRGVNRDEKKIQMSEQFPNSRHFLTYQHSLRSYASILYLRLPKKFKMILRGKEIEHHDIGDDMMIKDEITYKPHYSDAKRLLKDTDVMLLVAVVKIGFVKDAKDHIDVQGFNVYHKNRLIKPFWRVWNAAGSDGRGVIGVLEANFVEPAHDKQGFERTSVLARLEAKLVQMQKQYWSTNCHRIGYAPRRKKLINDSKDEGDSSSQEIVDHLIRSSGKNISSHTASSQNANKASLSVKYVDHSTRSSDKNLSPGSVPSQNVDKVSLSVKYVDHSTLSSSKNLSPCNVPSQNADKVSSLVKYGSTGKIKNLASSSINKLSAKHSWVNQEIGNGTSTCKSTSHKRSYTSSDDDSDGECIPVKNQQVVGFQSSPVQNQNVTVAASVDGTTNGDILSIEQLKEENNLLQERLKEMEETISQEKQWSKSLAEKLEVAEKQLEEINKEQEALIDIFSEERNRRDGEEDALRKKLKDSAVTIRELTQKLKGKNSAMPES